MSHCSQAFQAVQIDVLRRLSQHLDNVRMRVQQMQCGMDEVRYGLFRFLLVGTHPATPQPGAGVQYNASLSQMRTQHADTATAAAYSDRMQRLRELTQIQDQVVAAHDVGSQLHCVQGCNELDLCFKQ